MLCIAGKNLESSDERSRCNLVTVMLKVYMKPKRLKLEWNSILQTFVADDESL